MKASINILDKIPTSAMREITDTDSANVASGPDNSDSVLSVDDFKGTAEHAKEPLLQGLTEGPNAPNPPNTPNGLPSGAQPGTKLGNVLGGKMATEMQDILLPSIAVWVVSMIGYNIPKGKLQMTAKEREVLTPAWQAYLDSINVNFNNPLYNLMFVIGGIYAAKVVEIIPEIKQISKPKSGAKSNSEQSEGKTVDQILKEIQATRKKSRQDAIDYYNKNKEKYAHYLINRNDGNG